MRHGETDWNATGRVQGHDDSARLTPRGAHQVERVATLLAGKDIECVYSSDLQRARQSASVIAEATNAPVVIDRRLRERGFGQLEGGSTAGLDPAVTGITGRRITDIHCHPVGGESLDQLYQRCRGFVDQLHSLGHGRDIVVVAHGGSIRLIRAAWADAAPDRLAWSPVDNAALFRLVHPTSPSIGDGIVPVPVTNVPEPTHAPRATPIAPTSSASSPATTRQPSTVGRLP